MQVRSLIIASAIVLLTSLATASEPSAARQTIASKDAPAAIGPYSQAVLVNGVLYVSGQIALDPKSGQMAAADIRSQTRQVFANLGAVLAAAGMSLEDAVRVEVFLADMNDFAAMNEEYSAVFKPPYPARFTLQAARLPRDARVEIALIATKAAASR